MKSILLFFLFVSNVFSNSIYAQSVIVSGIVYGDSNKPLAFANISIEGTVDGTNSEVDGTFLFETSATGQVIFSASMIGYQTYTLMEDVSKLNNLTINLKPQSKVLDEIVVSASSFQLKGGSGIQKATAVDLVTTAGSGGDLYKAIAMLPGTQASGVDGKLLVRGGDTRESQTYIDEMHVLRPYTSMPNNVSVRGRYSPFLFEGINFSMGGYSSEYSQGLSSVLPLSTKDKSPISKWGGGVMSTGLETGGTRAWKNGSASFNVDYTNIAPYEKLFYPKSYSDQIVPYWNLSAQNQFRFDLGEKTVLKTYYTYDKTRFKKREREDFTSDERNFNFEEDNIYLNSTFKTRSNSGINFFAGAAFSFNNQQIDNAKLKNDRLRMKESETHLKFKADKRFSNLYKLGFGTETMLRRYDFMYADNLEFAKKFGHSINGVYISNDFNPIRNLYMNVSSRLEYTSLNKSWKVLPRAVLNYDYKGFLISAAYGRYQQLTDNDFLIYNTNLKAEDCEHLVFGINQKIGTKVYRIEAYHKKYDKLTTYRNDTYTSSGKGFSNGVDVFLQDRKFSDNWEYILSYSYNNSKRENLDYSQIVTPKYATKHNASISLKYSLMQYKTIWGITNRFASGRPYQDPNKEGFMNAITPIYNSLDLCVTYLAHKRLIVYASAQNILNRTNVFDYKYNKNANAQGRFDRVATTSYHNQFFFIGFFFTLSGNTAYDASNF